MSKSGRPWYPVLRGSLTGSKLKTRSGSARDVYRRLQQMFIEEQAGYAAISDNSLLFSGSMFRASWTTNILYPSGKGIVLVEDRSDVFILSYRVSFLRLILIGLLAAMFAAYPLWQTLYSGRPWSLSMASAPTAFFITYFVVMYFGSTYRFRRWLRSGLVSIPDKHA